MGTKIQISNGLDLVLLIDLTKLKRIMQTAEEMKTFVFPWGQIVSRESSGRFLSIDTGFMTILFAGT